MDDKPPNGNFWLRTLTALAIALVTAVLFYPICGTIDSPGKSTAKTSTLCLVTALKAYYTEYGKWPDFTGDGLFLDEKRQAQLLQMLCGKDERNNSRKIVFFEGRTAQQRRWFGEHYGGGFHPKTGAYLDPWGNLYCIAIDSDYDEEIANPYPDDPPIHARVIVWSIGKDGKQGSPANPHTCKGSDDVTSWQ